MKKTINRKSTSTRLVIGIPSSSACSLRLNFKVVSSHRIESLRTLRDHLLQFAESVQELDGALLHVEDELAHHVHEIEGEEVRRNRHHEPAGGGDERLPDPG